MSKIKWSELHVSPPISKSLSKLPFQELTEIQALTIPEALNGKDVIALAQTGSGKTLAYAIPALEHVQKLESQVLILAPTRELAEQIHDVFQQVRPSAHLRLALLVGGSSMLPQLRNLKARPQIVVGTPGRVLDHVRRKTLLLSQVDFFVLDECDRMLDMGFAPQIEDVMKNLPENRQTLLFSATLPPSVEKSFSRKMRNPIRLGAEVRAEAPTQIVQRSLQMKQTEKMDRLIEELHQKKGSTIIFTRTKSRTDRVAKYLIESGYKTSRLHGDRSQRQRREAIENFRTGRSDILVATDIAARGLDIPHIKLVINFDLPQTAEDFVHRIGRTGRAGAEGESVSFVTPEDQSLWRQIDRLMNKSESSPAPRFSPKASSPRAASSRSFSGRSSRPRSDDFRRREPREAKPWATEAPREFREPRQERGERPARGAWGQQRPSSRGQDRSESPRRNAFSGEKPLREFRPKTNREESRKPRHESDSANRPSTQKPKSWWKKGPSFGFRKSDPGRAY